MTRDPSWQIPEANFFDGPVYPATSSDDIFPKSGIGGMMANSGHERMQYASTRRRELKKR